MQQKPRIMFSLCSTLFVLLGLFARPASSVLADTEEAANVTTPATVTTVSAPAGVSAEEWNGIVDQITQSDAPSEAVALSAFSQQAYLKASNSEKFDRFGWAVDLDGNTLVVGAYGENSNANGINGDQADNTAPDAGAVYVFVRDVNGVWSQQAYLKASNSDAEDRFGWSVDIEGDTLAVGAHVEASNDNGVNGNQNSNLAPGAGAVYIFTRSSGVWSQQAYLKASNSDADDHFGYSLALNNNSLAVGAYWEDSAADGVGGNQNDNTAPFAGAVYLFTRNSSNVWSQQAYLKASNSEEGDRFGWSVALSGDTLTVGAVGEKSDADGINGNQNNNTANDAGAVYVFVRSAGLWTQQAYLKASNSDALDLFGYSLSLKNDSLVVGAEGEDSAADGVNGNQADNSALDAGAAYLFVRSAGVWSQQAYLKASNSEAGDGFGSAVTLLDNLVAAGAPYEDSAADGIDGNQADNSTLDAGAAYLFARNGTVWSQQSYLKASNSEANDRYGYSAILAGDQLAVGAFGEASAADGVNGNQADNTANEAGAVYLYQAPSATIQGQLLLGSTSAGSLTNPDSSVVNFGDEDLLTFDLATNRWSKYFDGSDVGLTNTDVDAVIVEGGNLLLSLEVSATLPGVGVVQPQDIVRFKPTSLGENTRGSYEWFLDGSDVGLDNSGEDIDAATLLLDGRLAVSTRLTATVAGLVAADEDWIVLNNAQFGENSAGSWQLYFDGSDVALTQTDEDVRGAEMTSAGELLLATSGAFSVPGVVGDASDVFVCKPISVGATTSCVYRLLFDGELHGFGAESIDDLELLETVVALTSADAEDTILDHPDADDHSDAIEEGNGEEEIEVVSQVYLPWMSR